MLAIGTRKAGKEIHCPKCGAAQTVPETSEVAANSKQREAAGESSGAAFEDVTVYDDDETPPGAGLSPPTAAPPLESPPADAPQHAEVEPPSVPPRPAESPATEPPLVASRPAASKPAPPVADRAPTAPERPLPSGTILMPRYVIYWQGALFLVVAAVAFAAGYFIGRGDASLELQVAEEQKAKEKVLVEGRLVYNPGTGSLAPDEDAVVIILPENAQPENKIPAQGIRPHDPPPRESHEDLLTIEALGGGYARADESGLFSFVLPEQGRYWVLIISRHAARPTGQRIDPVDHELLDRIFLVPEHVVGSRKYVWELRDLELGMEPLDHNFGRDGEAS